MTREQREAARAIEAQLDQAGALLVILAKAADGGAFVSPNAVRGVAELLGYITGDVSALSSRT